jgi:hypothetical protein
MVMYYLPVIDQSSRRIAELFRYGACTSVEDRKATAAPLGEWGGELKTK